MDREHEKILDKLEVVSENVQATRTEVAVIGQRLVDHQEQDRVNFEALGRQHTALGGDVHTLTQEVGRLEGYRDAAKAEGGKAGRKAGIGWAAAVVAIVAFAERVWAHFSGG